jgi:hypothetical protein
MFETKTGKAQWEVVAEVLETKNIGDIVTDFPEASLNGVVWHAIRKYRDHKRTFERVRKVGWCMVKASEHSRLARKQQVKSVRRLTEAKSIAGSADLSLLDPEQRRSIQAQFLHLSQLHDQVSRRVDRLDRRVGVVEKEQVSTEDKVERLADLLRRHGITDDE